MIPFGSSSNTTANAAVPDAPTMGYTIVSTGPNLCDLYSVDLVTGVLTDLPATTSEAACAADLAVAPNGTVYGIAGTQYLGPVAVAPAYDSFGGAELITYSADGTPSGLSLTIDDLPITGLSGGGIAVDAAGTVYIIAINETTCDPRLTAPGSFDPSDTYVFSCLYSVNLTTGALTQIGEALAANTTTWGLTSCTTNLWTVSDQVPPLSIDSEPASLAFPWLSINPTTAAVTPGGGANQLFGYDCLASHTTIYALSGDGIGDTSLSGPAVVAPPQTLGTVDPNTGVFNPTVAVTPTLQLGPFPAFAVVPPQEPAPAPPVFTH